MCLHHKATAKEIPATSRIGYKLMYERDLGNRIEVTAGYFQDHQQGQECFFDKYTEDKRLGNKDLYYENGNCGTYPCGFHLSTSLEDVESFRKQYGWFNATIYKVRYSDVLARGFQSGTKVLVVRRIKLLERIEK